VKGGLLLERIGLPYSVPRKQAADMYHTTGFSKDEIIDLCALVYANEENCNIEPWPPPLGLYKSVVIALTYMRRSHEVPLVLE